MKVDFARLDEVIALRNDIEHYSTSVAASKMRELLAKSFVVIRDFMVAELDADPAELLGAETWSVLLREGEVYGKERAACLEEMGEVDWRSPSGHAIAEHIRCPHCDSDLMRPVSADVGSVGELVFRCLSCGVESDFEEVVERAVSDCFFPEQYMAMTDGGDPPLAMCHTCLRETFLLAEGRCFACSGRLEYERCAICHAALGPDEQEYNGLCNCHAWQAEKDD